MMQTVSGRQASAGAALNLQHSLHSAPREPPLLLHCGDFPQEAGVLLGSGLCFLPLREARDASMGTDTEKERGKRITDSLVNSTNEVSWQIRLTYNSPEAVFQHPSLKKGIRYCCPCPGRHSSTHQPPFPPLPPYSLWSGSQFQETSDAVPAEMQTCKTIFKSVTWLDSVQKGGH